MKKKMIRGVIAIFFCCIFGQSIVYAEDSTSGGALAEANNNDLDMHEQAITRVGRIEITNAPTSANNAANKIYVDSQIADQIAGLRSELMTKINNTTTNNTGDGGSLVGKAWYEFLKTDCSEHCPVDYQIITLDVNSTCDGFVPGPRIRYSLVVCRKTHMGLPGDTAPNSLALIPVPLSTDVVVLNELRSSFGFMDPLPSFAEMCNWHRI